MILCGILNLTEDSFSDGGRYLGFDAAIAHGDKLLADGADWLDVGAESSNPRGKDVPVAEQIVRLGPVIEHFAKKGTRVAIDTHRPEVMQAALNAGARMINDVTALSDPRAVAVAARSDVSIVLMFSRAKGFRASLAKQPAAGIIDEVLSFFVQRLDAIESDGIARHRVIIDPGMGFFLGANPEPSFEVLRRLGELKTLGRPLYVCTSRKSFVASSKVPPLQRGPGTLMTEIWALAQGAEFVRTHDPAALKQGWAAWCALSSNEG